MLPPSPATATFLASPAVFPPVEPPLAVVSPLAEVELPPVFPPFPPDASQPAFWQVSAEPPMAFPPEAPFRFPAFPPAPVPAPPVALPPLAYALPLVADALL